MIDLSVTQLEVTAAVLTASLVVSGPNLTIGPGVLLSHTLEPAISGFVDLSEFRQDDKAYGRLRDKGVTHAKASGTVTVPCNEIDYGSSGASWYIPWGTDGQRLESFGDTWYSNSTYNILVVNPVISYWYFFDETNALVLSMVHRDGTKYYRKSDGSLYLTTGVQETWYLQRFTLVGTAIRRSTQTVSGSYATQSITIGGVSYPITQAGLASLNTGSTTVVTQADVSSSDPVRDPQALFDECRLTLERDRRYEEINFMRPEGFDFGLLSVELLDQLKVIDENVLFLIFDIADAKHLIRSERTKGFLESFQEFWGRVAYILSNSGGNSSRKLDKIRRAASMYLWKEYAFDTIFPDIQRIRDGLVEFVSSGHVQRLHSRRVALVDDGFGEANTYTAVLTAEVGEYPSWVLGRVQAFIGSCKKFGVYPRLTDLWDILPYSFVVDWLVDFQGFFDDVATYQEVRDYFPVDHVIYSEKWVRSIAADRLVPYQASGSVEYSFYHRWITEELPLPPVSLGWGPGLTTKWVQTSALVVQRSRPRGRSL